MSLTCVKLIRLYLSNMCSLLYINYTSIKFGFFFKPEEGNCKNRLEWDKSSLTVPVNSTILNFQSYLPILFPSLSIQIGLSDEASLLTAELTTNGNLSRHWFSNFSVA